MRAWQDFVLDDMGTYAAAFAYHLLFALFPFLLFLIAVFTLIEMPGLFDWFLEQFQSTVPEEVMNQIENALDEALAERQGGLLSISILLTVWFASIGVRSAINALNLSYDVEESRPVWKRYLLSILYTIGLAIIMVLATFLMFFGPQVTNWLGEQVGVQEYVLLLWRWLRLPVAILSAMFTVAIIYFVLPNVEGQRFYILSPGSILTVLLWLAVSFGFQYWVANFAAYNLTYGSIGTVIMLLTYLFLCALILLFGAEINSVIRRCAPVPDDPKPAGPPLHRKSSQSP